MKVEERELLRSLQEGEETAFEHFYNQMAPRWVSFLMGRKGPYRLTLDDARDVVQQALLVILSKASTFEPTGTATFSTWCYGIVIKVAAWRTRENLWHIYLSDVEEELLSTDSLDEETAEGQDISLEDGDIEAWLAGDGEVQNALRSLRKGERQVILLKVLGGLTHKDIANRLGKSEAAVRVQFHRAVGKLRSLLEWAGSNAHGKRPLHQKITRDASARGRLEAD